MSLPHRNFIAMQRRPTHLCVLALLLPGAAWAQLAPAPGADPAVSGPAQTCYQQARNRGTDPYACDLAIQMARDAGEAEVQGGAANAALAAALNNRALVLANDGRLEPALEDLDAALEVSPADAEIHANRGNLLLRLERAADALRAYDRAVELAPNDPVGYYNRAFAYLALGEREAAERELARARGLLPQRDISDQSAPARRARPGR